MILRVADYIIEKIYNEGAKHLYMITGRGMLYLSDAVAKQGEIQPICMHNEQAVAYAAMAYAQMNESIGACLVSTGCASTNAVSGVLCAWQDSVPMIVISGQNKLNETTYYTGKKIRTFGSQEANIIDVVKSITKYAVMLTNPEDVVYEIEKSLYEMNNGRRGPVWIDVPLDVQNARIDVDKVRHFVPENIGICEESIRIAVKKTIAKFEKSERPVILVGSGVRAAGAIKELRAFATANTIPVVYTPSGADTCGSGEKMGIGSIGSLGGTREGNFALQNADFVLALGCSLQTLHTGINPGNFIRQGSLWVVDIEKEQHEDKEIRIDCLIEADLSVFLKNLQKHTISLKHNLWVERCMHWKSVFPLGKEVYDVSERVDLYYLAENLSKIMDNKTCIVSDAGYEELIIPSSVHFCGEQRCIHPAAQGAMGYALPAAIAVRQASGNRTIAVIGDGSVMMNLQELQTIVSNNVNVILLIINNNAYSVIRRRQTDLFRNRTIGTDSGNGVTCPEFEKVATCFGLKYLHISNNGELIQKLVSLVNEDGPILCEIDAMENQRYLHESIGINSKNRLVKKPLEDLSPFLDREVFEAEMIIDPVD